MSPVSNTSARQGSGEESNVRNVAPETNALAMSPWALSSQNGAFCHRFVRAKLFSTEVGNPTSLHTEVGLGPWSRAWQSWVGHRIAASILRWQQDCPSHSCATHRIALNYQQLWLGAVLARAQPRDPALL